MTPLTIQEMLDLLHERYFLIDITTMKGTVRVQSGGTNSKIAPKLEPAYGASLEEALNNAVNA